MRYIGAVSFRGMRPYVAYGRCQFRVGVTYVRDGVDRYRWIGLTWQL